MEQHPLRRLRKCYYLNVSFASLYLFFSLTPLTPSGYLNKFSPENIQKLVQQLKAQT